ncbi:MAG: hypothetical protein HY289_13220 [Planctomycetes bacterium]|nr:hypothetical protein [Planctomycetota bacterium]
MAGYFLIVSGSGLLVEKIALTIRRRWTGNPGAMASDRALETRIKEVEQNGK